MGTKDILALIFRHVLSAAGGVAVGTGVADGETVNAIGGAVATIVAGILSILSKRKNK